MPSTRRGPRAPAATWRSTAWVGAPPGDLHNDFIHRAEDDPVSMAWVIKFHMIHTGDLQQICEIPDTDGILLDNTSVVWSSEMCIGGRSCSPAARSS